MVVEVADDGVGMDEETCEHLFEPFLTTKGGAGAGVGLAVVFGLVDRAGGSIGVGSLPRGGGACMRAYLTRVATGV